MDARSQLAWPMPVLQMVVVVPITVNKAVMVEFINREGDTAVVIPKEYMAEATEAADM